MNVTHDQAKISLVNVLVGVLYTIGVGIGLAFGTEPAGIIDMVIDLSVLLVIVNVLVVREEWKRVFKR